MEQSALRSSAVDVITAWDALPEGHHNPLQVSAWLTNVVRPAIDNLRKDVAATPAPVPRTPRCPHGYSHAELRDGTVSCESCRAILERMAADD